MSQDYDYLYRLAVNPESSFRWRLRGTTPDPRSFEALLWEQVLVQFLVVRTDSGQPIGLVSCFAPDMRSRVANLAIVIAPEFTNLGLAADALALFVDYVFALWNFRILYADIPEYNYGQLSSGAESFFSVEARVSDRYWHRGRYWDNVLLSLTRLHWEKIAPRLLRALRGDAATERS